MTKKKPPTSPTARGAPLTVNGAAYVVLTMEQMSMLLDGPGKLSGTDLRIALIMAREIAGKHGWFIPGGVPEIAARAGVHEASGWRSVSVLESRGFLVREKRTDKRGFNRSNKYTMPTARPRTGASTGPRTGAREEVAPKRGPKGVAPVRPLTGDYNDRIPLAPASGGSLTVLRCVAEAVLPKRYTEIAERIRTAWRDRYTDILTSADDADDAAVVQLAIDAGQVDAATMDAIFGSRVEEELDVEGELLMVPTRQRRAPDKRLAARARKATAERYRRDLAVNAARLAAAETLRTFAWTRDRQIEPVSSWLSTVLRSALDAAERQLEIG